MSYRGVIEISRSDFELYNKLYEVQFDEDTEYMKKLIEQTNAVIDDEINIGGIEFENGYYMSLYLNSGSSNYYENYVLFDDNGCEVWCNDLCDYEFNDFIVELENNDTYKIEFKVV